jgi:hypothetical protein
VTWKIFLRSSVPGLVGGADDAPSSGAQPRTRGSSRA